MVSNDEERAAAVDASVAAATDDTLRGVMDDLTPPGPGGQTTTVQGSQRPQFKAKPGSDGKLTDASAGAHVADPVTGNGGLDSAPPAAFNCGRHHWLDPTSRQDCWKGLREKAPPGFEPQAFGVCSRKLTMRLLEIEC